MSDPARRKKIPSISDTVRATIARHHMIPPGSKVLVACSGGPDSVALLHLLIGLGVDVAVAHFNHRLRGSEADRDAEFVRELSSSLGPSYYPGEGDVAAEARRLKLNTEDCARRMRLAFLRETAQAAGADRVALGHTADDLVETLLMKLFRGSGRTGLTSIAPVRGNLIRPLIDVRKREVLRFLEQRSLAFVMDSSNLDMSRTRNRVRAELMPLIDRLFPAGIRRARSAVHVLLQEEVFLQQQATKALQRCLLDSSPLSVTLDRQLFKELSPAILARAIRLAAAALGSPVGAERVAELIDWCTSDSSPSRFRSMLPGRIRVHRRRQVIEIQKARPRVGDFCDLLSVPGALDIAPTGERIEAGVIDARQFPAEVRFDDRIACYLDLDKAGETLTVRNRRPGDSYRPIGAAEPRRVKTMLINKKVPEHERDRLPVVLIGDRICWVAGLPVGEDFKVTERTTRIAEIRRILPGLQRGGA
ncbi:MAG: tRNA lysidine(34) synthetase TilS [Acidobacteriota bacterium]